MISNKFSLSINIYIYLLFAERARDEILKSSNYNLSFQYRKQNKYFALIELTQSPPVGCYDWCSQVAAAAGHGIFN